MIIRFISFIILLSFVVFAYAVPAYANEADAAFERRLVLAKQMNDIRPVRQQVGLAVDRVAEKLSLNDRDVFKREIMISFDFEDLEELSIRTMADIFTDAELQKMVDYFSTPEARSISKKQKIYEGILQPEILKILDKAFMKIRTGKAGN